MRFQCPFCSTVIDIPDEYRGYRVACSHCDKRIIAPSSPFEEDCVIGDFVIRAKLGEGANGAVFKAFQLSLERIVALKILFNKNITEKGLIEFQREARAAAKLIHVNLVQSYAVGEDNGICYMAMTYINGETLKSRIRRTGPIPCDEALHIIQQVAEALHYAWTESHLIHRDVKPDNIMLSEDGIVKLTDLGLAMNQAEWKEGMDISGSPSYMSPEQFAGEPLDTRSDIYSLGVTLYQMLSGELPFDAETLRSIARQHFEVAVPDINKKVSGLPASVGKLIKKMMAKTPDKRFKDMEEVLGEIWQIRQITAPHQDMVPDVHTISLRRLDYDVQLQPKSDPSTPSLVTSGNKHREKDTSHSLAGILIVTFLLVCLLAVIVVLYRKDPVVPTQNQKQEFVGMADPVFEQLELFKQSAKDPSVRFEDLQKTAQALHAELESGNMKPIQKEALQQFVLTLLNERVAGEKEAEVQAQIAELQTTVSNLKLELESSRSNEKILTQTVDEQQQKINKQIEDLAELPLLKNDLEKLRQDLASERKLALESMELVRDQLTQQLLSFWQKQQFSECSAWLDEMQNRYPALREHHAHLKKFNNVLVKTAEKLKSVKNESAGLALYSGTVSHLENGVVYCITKDSEGAIKVSKIPWYELPADDIISLITHEKKNRQPEAVPDQPPFAKEELPVVHAVYLVLTGDCTSLYTLQPAQSENAVPLVTENELACLKRLADKKSLALAEQIRILSETGKTPVKTLFQRYQKFCQHSPHYVENMKEFLPRFEKKETTRPVEKTIVP